MRAYLTLMALAALFSAPALAQWNSVKTAGIPRTADGKPNLAAPAPRTADGKPDLTGIWQAGWAVPFLNMDGRDLPKDPNPTWLGYSVGHWEGDTLVVNSVGFNDLGWLDIGGNPQTESLRLTKRFRRTDFGHLQLDVTFDDTKTFTKPFTLSMVKTYTADTEIFEDVCENERDSGHLLGELPGRQAVVKISGDQVIIEDSAYPRDQLFVARSETVFLSSVSEVSIQFVKDSKGAVTHFTRTGGAKDEKALRQR